MATPRDAAVALSGGPSNPAQRRRQKPPLRPQLPGKASTSKVRTSHACDRCRVMRTKCSNSDRCTKCIKDDAVCIYGDRKRERNRKDLVESLDRVDSLKSENNMLRDVLRAVTERPGFRPEDNSDIMDILAKASSNSEQDDDDDDDEPSFESSSQSQSRTPFSSSKKTTTTTTPGSSRPGKLTGETRADSSVGSPGRQGLLQHIVSLDSGGGASGFVGKMSEISWIQRAFETVRGRGDDRGIVHPGEMDIDVTSTTDFIYFTDDVNLLAIDEDFVDHHHIPGRETVVLLSEAFFHAMQGAFHFVLRERFLHEALEFLIDEHPLTWDQRRWLALANLVWAIGSKWIHITKMNGDGIKEDHLVYYARARALGLDHRVMFDHPDIERIQGIGLLSFYLLINGSITRAWNTLGHATRHATALGLHLQVTDHTVNEVERSRRARTWYSLYSLEVLISEITGRPKSIFMADVTIPLDVFRTLPREIEGFSGQVDDFMSPVASRKMWVEYLQSGQNISQMTGGMIPWKSFSSVGKSVPVSYFPQRLRLCRLSDQTASELYSGTSNGSWLDVQNKISEIQADLRQWADSLPPELTIAGDSGDTDPRTKIELAMYYYSVEMILNRPCLCEIDIEDESDRSREFNRNAARTCVHAAMSMLGLMPDYPTAHEAYQLLPWWSLLHLVTQATAVILLELALDAQHFLDEVPQLAVSLRKSMSYLWCMTDQSLSAYRAWKICRQLLSEVKLRHEKLDLADIPTAAVAPAGWTDEMEAATMKAISRPGADGLVSPMRPLS